MKNLGENKVITNKVTDKASVIIIGAGHAGCEAALASARLGLETIIFTLNLDSIAMMPCNPSIGGSSKGHLVREIDALGGEMGKNIDKTYIQTKMLNTGKGPAVYSLRAQADKNAYSKAMKKTLENESNLKIKQEEVIKIVVDDIEVKGVITKSNSFYEAKAVVLAMGTYMKSRCLYGETINDSGPNGLMNAKELSDNLLENDVFLYRFKTGTPARVSSKSIDFTKVEIQNGDLDIVPFSFENTSEDIKKEQIPCYLAYTNLKTHEIIKNNLHRSPMYSGIIKATGTRYCPSIEDKIVRFADKERHQIFIEPEGLDTEEMYIQGMSSSLPYEIQIEMYRSIKGLENCEIMRPAYAIEYDCIDATKLDLSLEFKHIKGVFSCGQFNGSSGYEEAAAQGLIAGINASMKVLKKEPIILKRSDAYIGVLIDDLVTKGTKEPYRMMTSRAEYRLLLRQDNADFRLTPIGYKIGLIKKDRYDKYLEKIEIVNEEVSRIKKENIPPSEKLFEILKINNSSPINTGVKLADLIKRPELDYFKLKDIDENRKEYDIEILKQCNIIIKYEGYIKQQMDQVMQFKKLEEKLLPMDLDYMQIKGLRLEAKQKLSNIKPKSVGHASRISGVSPADISVLLVYIKGIYKK